MKVEFPNAIKNENNQDLEVSALPTGRAPCNKQQVIQEILAQPHESTYHFLKRIEIQSKTQNSRTVSVEHFFKPSLLLKGQGSQPENLSYNINSFAKMDVIGEGTYGKVFKSRLVEDMEASSQGQVKLEQGQNQVEVVDSEPVDESHKYKALKLLKLDEEREGFPITALREIQILKKLNHKNIVRLEDVFSFAKGEGDNWQRNRIYLVFEFVPHDLMGMIDYKPKFSAAQIKCILK